MAREDAEFLLETDMANPGAEKSGEFLLELVLGTSNRIVRTDRSGLAEVLRDWIALRTEPRTMLAVAVVEDLRLVELRASLEELRADIVGGHAFKPWYLPHAERALAALA